MTVVAAYASVFYQVTVSDRLVTVAGAQYDSRSNKVIVAALSDALITIAYTGVAFVDGVPTDDWIMRQLAPSIWPSPAVQIGDVLELPTTLKEMVARLVAAIRGRSQQCIDLWRSELQVGLCGIANLRGVTSPYLLVISKAAQTAKLSFELKPRFPLRSLAAFAGWVSGGYGNARREIFVPMVEELAVASIDPNSPTVPSRVQDILLKAARTAAAVEETIGDEFLIVTHRLQEHTSTIEFLPTGPHSINGELGDVLGPNAITYTPWIFGDSSVVPPLELISDLRLGLCGHEFFLRGGQLLGETRGSYLGLAKRRQPPA